jgi:hypothetical protein
MIICIKPINVIDVKGTALHKTDIITGDNLGHQVSRKPQFSTNFKNIIINCIFIFNSFPKEEVNSSWRVYFYKKSFLFREETKLFSPAYWAYKIAMSVCLDAR